MKDATKNVKCKKCGFCFCVENKPAFAWMDDYEGCFMPNDYCEKIVVDNPSDVVIRSES